jgi:hypothetical protein
MRVMHGGLIQCVRRLCLLFFVYQLPRGDVRGAALLLLGLRPGDVWLYRWSCRFVRVHRLSLWHVRNPCWSDESGKLYQLHCGHVQRRYRRADSIYVQAVSSRHILEYRRRRQRVDVSPVRDWLGVPRWLHDSDA